MPKLLARTLRLTPDALRLIPGGQDAREVLPSAIVLVSMVVHVDCVGWRAASRHSQRVRLQLLDPSARRFLHRTATPEALGTGTTLTLHAFIKGKIYSVHPGSHVLIRRHYKKPHRNRMAVNDAEHTVPQHRQYQTPMSKPSFKRLFERETKQSSLAAQHERSPAFLVQTVNVPAVGNELVHLFRKHK
eukprot:2886590-Rhodomonas_salina.1